MILIDTSVWVETFKRNQPLQIESVVDVDEIVTCLPVIQEVLQGFRDERAFRLAREAMTAFPILESPLHMQVFEEAAGLYRAARRSGLTVRSSIDCLIAACAIRGNHTVLHRDRDFPLIAQVSPLQERSV